MNLLVVHDLLVTLLVVIEIQFQSSICCKDEGVMSGKRIRNVKQSLNYVGGENYVAFLINPELHTHLKESMMKPCECNIAAKAKPPSFLTLNQQTLSETIHIDGCKYPVTDASQQIINDWLDISKSNIRRIN